MSWQTDSYGKIANFVIIKAIQNGITLQKILFTHQEMLPVSRESEHRRTHFVRTLTDCWSCLLDEQKSLKDMNIKKKEKKEKKIPLPSRNNVAVGNLSVHW